MTNPITPPPPHLLKKFSAQARDESNKRNGAGYLKTFAILCIEWSMNSQPTPNDRQIRSSDITPPEELVQQWLCSDDYQWGPLEQTSITITANRLQNVATRAAQWGADQELEACCQELPGLANLLRDERRPKPPSLKEQALGVLGRFNTNAHTRADEMTQDFDLIRRALEALPND